jgi:hypothetical protein
MGTSNWNSLELLLCVPYMGTAEQKSPKLLLVCLTGTEHFYHFGLLLCEPYGHVLFLWLRVTIVSARRADRVISGPGNL